MKTFLLQTMATILVCLANYGTSVAQSVVTRSGELDAGGITEYSQYLYIGPGAHITIAAGQQWIIASQYIFIAPSAIIDGGGDMVLDDPANFGALSESISWSGQPVTIDGGNSKLLVNVINRNPNNIILGAVAIAASLGDIAAANTDQTLYIGTGFIWATTHGSVAATPLAYNDVLLGNNDFKFASAATQSGYTQNGYAVTNGTGHVVKENYTGAWTYPVGIAESSAGGSDYTPVAIDNTIANGMHVSVLSYTTSSSVEAGDNGIARTWSIYADAAAGNSIINLQHNVSTNQPTFNNASNFVTRYSATMPNTTGQNASSVTAWQSNNLGAGSATGSLTTGSAIASASERSLAYTNFATSASQQMSYYSKSSNLLAPLPVRLQGFAAVAGDCNALLTWKTANEQHFSHFNVETSADGVSFEKIGTLPGHNIDSGSSYRFTYAARKGTWVYRLVLVDADGQYTCSNLVQLTVNCGRNPVVVYPNPTRNIVLVSGLSGGEQIKLYNMAGILLFNKKATGAGESIDVSSFPAGNYNITIVKGAESLLRAKVIKLN